MLTIQRFSEKTGLSPSALRFYDRKGLIVPEQRLDNGYRAYSESQIADALLIHSLRNADIEIEEIKRYLHSEETAKEQLIFKWRHEVKAKLSALRIADQYLGGFSTNEKHIHLVRWDDPVQFVWFRHTVRRNNRPFHEVAFIDELTLKECGYKLAPYFFVRQLDSRGSEMTGDVGFIVTNANSLKTSVKGAYTEQLEPTLFASMECHVENAFLCFQFIQMIRQYGFKPSGAKLEKYDDFKRDTFQYLIPISM